MMVPNKSYQSTGIPHQHRTGRAAKWALLTAITVAALLPTTAAAQVNTSKPKPVAGVEVVERPDARLPLDLEFFDSDGQKVRLGDYFDGELPVILTMNYSNCPMLCSLQLNGLLAGMKKMQWDLGQKYHIVTVSLDPLESPDRAELTRQKYLKLYNRPGTGAGWPFLTTPKDKDIKALAETVGFGYVQDEKTGDYLHPAVFMVCTPDGRVSRYLYGIEFDQQTLRLALTEASEGKIGTTMDRVLLYCFQYDADRNSYGPAAFRIMQLAGGLTVIVLGGVLSAFWWRERRRRKDGTSDDNI